MTTGIASLDAQISRAVNARAEALRAEIYGLLERNRVGRGVQYPGNPNPSSLPGDPPARQSGRLMESIAVVTRATPAEPVALVGPRPQAFTGPLDDPDYPVVLEFGGGINDIEPRPYMRPAVDALRAKARSGG